MAKSSTPGEDPQKPANQVKVSRRPFPGAGDEGDKPQARPVRPPLPGSGDDRDRPTPPRPPLPGAGDDSDKARPAPAVPIVSKRGGETDKAAEDNQRREDQARQREQSRRGQAAITRTAERELKATIRGRQDSADKRRVAIRRSENQATARLIDRVLSFDKAGGVEDFRELVPGLFPVNELKRAREKLRNDQVLTLDEASAVAFVLEREGKSDQFDSVRFKVTIKDEMRPVPIGLGGALRTITRPRGPQLFKVKLAPDLRNLNQQLVTRSLRRSLAAAQKRAAKVRGARKTPSDPVPPRTPDIGQGGRSPIGSPKKGDPRFGKTADEARLERVGRAQREALEASAKYRRAKANLREARNANDPILTQNAVRALKQALDAQAKLAARATEVAAQDSRLSQQVKENDDFVVVVDPAKSPNGRPTVTVTTPQGSFVPRPAVSTTGGTKPKPGVKPAPTPAPGPGPGPGPAVMPESKRVTVTRTAPRVGTIPPKPSRPASPTPTGAGRPTSPQQPKKSPRKPVIPPPILGLGDEPVAASKIPRGQPTVLNYRQGAVYKRVNLVKGSIRTFKKIPPGGVRPGLSPQDSIKAVRFGKRTKKRAFDTGETVATVRGQKITFTKDTGQPAIREKLSP